MSKSMITNILNHVSNTAVVTGIASGIGYLCARNVALINSNWQVDTQVGLLVGAIAGAIVGLFNGKGANLSSWLVGGAALAIVPFQVCQKLDMPAPFKAVLAISITSASICVLITALGSKIFAKSKNSDPVEA